MKRTATLLLEDGRLFHGSGHGFEGEAVGEVVFNTSHTGYQEILTDPSYAGQIVTFTVAELGNYGVHHGDEQAAGPQVSGLVARRVCREPSNWRSDEPFLGWLTRHGVVGIEGVDTRRLVRVLRSAGAQQGIIDSSGSSAQALVEKARKLPGMEGQDLATKVSTRTAYEWNEGVLGRKP